MAMPPIKLKKFERELLRNPSKSPTDIAYKIYDCKDRQVAAVIASQNLSQLNITFQDIMERAGLTDEADAEDLKRLRKAKRLQSCDVYVQEDGKGGYKINENSNDFIEVDDNLAQIKALELSVKLKGRLKDMPAPNVQNNYFTLIKTVNVNGNGVKTDAGSPDAAGSRILSEYMQG